MKNSDKIKLRSAIKKLQKHTTSSNDCVITSEVKIESQFNVKINLIAADSKEELVMAIPNHGFDNTKQEKEKWFNSWQQVANKIGNKLKNSKWEKKYSLCHLKNGNTIDKVSDFINTFKNIGNNSQSVHFVLKV